MNIKQIVVTSYPPEVNKSYKKSETKFDEQENKIEFKEFSGGKATLWEQYLYDDNNRLIETIKYKGNSFKPEDYKAMSIKHYYDESGNLITDEKWIDEITPDGGRIRSLFYLNGTIKCRKFFNNHGKCSEENHYKKEVITKTITYNDDENILEVKNFAVNGESLNLTNNVYNDKGKLIHTKSISRTGNVSEDRILKYNEKHLLVEDIDHLVDPLNAHADILESSNGYNRKYFYNSADRVEIENLYLCGELVMTYKYNYIFW